jgi:hypothetical protein
MGREFRLFFYISKSFFFVELQEVPKLVVIVVATSRLFVATAFLDLIFARQEPQQQARRSSQIFKSVHHSTT